MELRTAYHTASFNHHPRGAWCICHSAGYCSLATRITTSQCYVYQQGSEGQRQWHIEWKENNQTFGLYYSSVAAVVHLYISKASEIHTTHQKICSDSSNAKCSSFHFYGSIACGSTYQHSITDIVIQLINERHGTNKVSKSYTKYENSTCRVAYQLYWEVLCSTLCYIRCYRCQRFGHVAAACLAKGERCSMCSGPHRTRQCKTQKLST